MPIGREPHRTREPRGLSPSGGKTPAKPHVFRAAPRPLARCGVKGGERKRVPSGHNRRRRLATGSRQPKRGFDTAVSKTTIEVAGHCPLCEPRGLSPSGGKTPAKPHVSRSPPRPTGAERGQGALPLVMRRRTWAVMSSRGVPPEARMALRMSASAMRWG